MRSLRTVSRRTVLQRGAMGTIGWVIVLCVVAGSASQAVADPPKITVGWDGHFLLGGWTLLSYRLPKSADHADARYRVDVVASDPDGNLVTFVGVESNGTGESGRLLGKFQLGQADGQIIARCYRDGTLIDERAVTAGGQEIRREPHSHSERFLITVGLTPEVRSQLDVSAPGKRTVIHFSDIDALPSDPDGYDGVLGVLIAGRQSPNVAQSQALERWVLGGGQLSVSLGISPGEFLETPMARWLPIQLAPQLTPTRDLSSLEAYAGKPVRIIPTGQRIDLPKITFSAGKPPVGNRVDEFLARAPHGCGTASLLVMDVTQAPLANWEGLSDLLRVFTGAADTPGARGERSQQLGSIGITELSSQVAAALEHFPAVERISPWWMLAGLFAVMALVGPVDYWLVNRVWRKPLVTWISFPLMLTLCSALALWAAASLNGDSLLVNQLDVIDVDVATKSARGRHWTTIYSPASQSYDVAFSPAWNRWKPSEARQTGLTAGWYGLPESSFGGMNQSRSRGVQLGTAAYDAFPEQGRFRQLPAAQWSTSALAGRSSGTLSGIVDSQLKSTATGRLTGTISHHFPAPLENWFLAYENRVYRIPPKADGKTATSFAPASAWRVDDPRVIYRELRGFLTQTTAKQVTRADASGRDIEYQQVNYDPSGRDLAVILPILSFHEEVGGQVYTGLTNDILSEQDLTPLLKLGRAILVGFLPEPGCDVELTPAETPVRRHVTLVRVILPVERSKQLLQELPKVKP